MSASSAREQSESELLRSQAQPCDRRDTFESHQCDLSMCLGWLNQAMRETGWNSTSLASHMERDRSYIDRVLSGEKPCSLAFILAMPKDIQAAFSELYAKSWGYIVVLPVSADVAINHLVSGLIGVLTQQKSMGIPKPRPAKAELRGAVRDKAVNE